MIRTVIIDDEPRNIKLIAGMISDHCSELEVVGYTDDPTEVLPLIQNLNPALLLLDIEFPSGTIFPVLEKLPQKNFQVIFITAHNTYAAEAFDQSVADYILKPVTVEKLVRAVQRAIKNLQSESSSDIQQLVEALKARLDQHGKVPLPSSDGILFIDESSIIHCEASGRYSIIYLEGNKKLTVTKTLKEIEALLSPVRFFRAHNSHIVNLSLVKKYHYGRGGTLELEDGSMVEVSSSRKAELLNVLLHRNPQ
jgi:two-component system, LytTR family, response regulator